MGNLIKLSALKSLKGCTKSFGKIGNTLKILSSYWISKMNKMKKIANKKKEK